MQSVTYVRECCEVRKIGVSYKNFSSSYLHYKILGVFLRLVVLGSLLLRFLSDFFNFYLFCVFSLISTALHSIFWNSLGLVHWL